jgi:hypothetical protein
MASTFTTNKHIEKPASGDYNNAWAAPVNADWDDIDNALGGHAAISVTGVGAGTYALTVPQYQPINVEFTGVLTAALVYVVPTGVGGIWSVSNGTTGAFSLTFGVSGGGSFVVPQGQRALLICDGTSMVSAQSPLAALAFSQITGTLANGQLVSSNVTQFQAALAIAFTQLTGAATVAQLPANAYRGTLGSGNVTVQSGGAPSGGANGDIFLIY